VHNSRASYDLFKSVELARNGLSNVKLLVLK